MTQNGEGTIESIETKTSPRSGKQYMTVKISGRNYTAWDAAGPAAQRLGNGKSVRFQYTSNEVNGKTYYNLSSIAEKQTEQTVGSLRGMALSSAIAFIQAPGVIKDGMPALDVVFSVAEQFETYLKGGNDEDLAVDEPE